jgi:hypothetical protein
MEGQGDTSNGPLEALKGRGKATRAQIAGNVEEKKLLETEMDVRQAISRASHTD